MRANISSRRRVLWHSPAVLPIANTHPFPAALVRLPLAQKPHEVSQQHSYRLEALGGAGGSRYNYRAGRGYGPYLSKELNASANWNANDWVKGASEFETEKYYPDITILSRAEQKALLPWLPTSGQLRWFQANDPGQAWVQWMAALIFFVVASKAPAIALAGGLYPLYSKQIRAAVKNAKTRFSGYEYVGVWHTKLQHASVVQQPFTTTAATQGIPPSPSLCVRVGDDGLDSLSTELDFPWVPGCQSIAPGDRVEVLVLAKTYQFSDFKVLREVYFPDQNLFLADYPFLKREVFQQVSAEIERSRAGDTSSRDADAYW